MKLKERIWVLKGILNHEHDEKDLQTIKQKQRKINQVPEGYLYPELIKR